MNGETLSNQNEQSAPQAEEWQSLQTVPLSSEAKQLVQEGIYDLDRKPTEDYLESVAGQKALSAEEKFNQDTERIDRYLTNLQEQVDSGAISEESAQKYREAYLAKQEAALDEAINQIDGYRQDYIDSQVVGTPEADWIDSPEVFSREEVLKQNPAVEAEGAAISANDKEAALADEKEKEAALADEKAENLAQVVEATSTEEAELRTAERQDAIKHAEASLEESVSPEEAERRATELQTMIERAKHIEAVDYRLNKLRSDLAELYVKKSRIFGPKHRAEFDETKKKYETTLDEYLRLQPHTTNEEFLENYLEQDQKLLDAVEDRIDNGNFYRKIVSRILGNEYYKKALLSRGVESLGVTSAANAILPEAPSAEAPQSVAQSNPQPEVASEASPQEQKSDDHNKAVTGNELQELTRREGISDFTERDIEMVAMSVTADKLPAANDRISEWWDNLDEAHQKVLLEYGEKHSRPSAHGNAFRFFLGTLNQFGNL